MWLSTAWSSGELVPGTSGLTLFSIILRGRWNWFLIVAWPALEPRGLSSSRSIGSRESKRESKREREREREKDTPPPLKAEAAAATPVSSLVDRPRSPPTQSSFSLSLSTSLIVTYTLACLSHLLSVSLVLRATCLPCGSLVSYRM